MARRVGPDGQTFGDPFWVNQTTIFNQRMSATAVAEDGCFLVLRRDEGHLFYGVEKSDVMGRLYEADGAARTDEFVVAPTQAGYPFAPRMAALPGGGYAVVWGRYAQVSESSLSDLDVMLRFIDASGAGPEPIRVNSQSTRDQWWPDIAVCEDGRMLVVWISASIEGDEGVGIVARWLGVDGAALSEEIHVNEYTASTQNFPVVTVTTDCHGVVLWQSLGQDGDQGGIFGRVLAAAGGPASAEFAVNSTTQGSQGANHFRTIAVDADGSGAFVASWPSNPNNNNEFSLLYLADVGRARC